jgi:hypothetical protein
MLLSVFQFAYEFLQKLLIILQNVA